MTSAPVAMLQKDSQKGADVGHRVVWRIVIVFGNVPKKPPRRDVYTAGVCFHPDFCLDGLQHFDWKLQRWWHPGNANSYQ